MTGSSYIGLLAFMALNLGGVLFSRFPFAFRYPCSGLFYSFLFLATELALERSSDLLQPAINRYDACVYTGTYGTRGFPLFDVVKY